MEARKIIITGGATRIGAAIAKKLCGPNKEMLIHFNKSKSSAEKLKIFLENKGAKVFLVKGDLSNEKDVNKIVKFAKKRPGPSELRARQINNIKQSNNVPVLAFTHPRDKWEGLLSDWLEEVPGVKRIVISEDYKINGKTCIVKGDNWQENITARKNTGHEMNQGLCFQYYNPVILDYIASRIK